MGARLWWHFGPYHSDIGIAIRQTAEQVLASGAYQGHISPEELRQGIAEFLDAEFVRDGFYAYNPQGREITSREEAIDQLVGGRTSPPTLENVRSYVAPGRTHTILDRYSHTWHETIQPLSHSALIRVFGTATPTHADVMARMDGLWEYLFLDNAPPSEYEQAEYLIVYSCGLPTEIFIWGAS